METNLFNLICTDNMRVLNVLYTRFFNNKVMR